MVNCQTPIDSWVFTPTSVGPCSACQQDISFLSPVQLRAACSSEPTWKCIACNGDICFASKEAAPPMVFVTIGTEISWGSPKITDRATGVSKPNTRGVLDTIMYYELEHDVSRMVGNCIVTFAQTQPLVAEIANCKQGDRNYKIASAFIKRFPDKETLGKTYKAYAEIRNTLAHGFITRLANVRVNGQPERDKIHRMVNINRHENRAIDLHPENLRRIQEGFRQLLSQFVQMAFDEIEKPRIEADHQRFFADHKRRRKKIEDNLNALGDDACV